MHYANIYKCPLILIYYSCADFHKCLVFSFVRCLASALTHHRPVPLLTAGSCLSVSQVRVFSPDGSGLLNTGLKKLHSHHNYNNETHLPNALCNYALFGLCYHGYSLCLCWNSECRLLKAITVGSTARSKVEGNTEASPACIPSLSLHLSLLFFRCLRYQQHKARCPTVSLWLTNIR